MPRTKETARRVVVGERQRLTIADRGPAGSDDGTARTQHLRRVRWSHV